jgi:hypothetical protein
MITIALHFSSMNSVFFSIGSIYTKQGWLSISKSCLDRKRGKNQRESDFLGTCQEKIGLLFLLFVMQLLAFKCYQESK